jgi:uncharacterized membrane protein YqjE
MSESRGLFTSLSRLLGSALEIFQVRLGILGTELELEKRRIFDGLMWGVLALMVLSVGIVLLCGFIILLFWEGYRLAAVGVMALLFLGSALLLMRHARQRLSSPKGMFDVSLAELKRDWSELQASSQHEQR